MNRPIDTARMSPEDRASFDFQEPPKKPPVWTPLGDSGLEVRQNKNSTWHLRFADGSLVKVTRDKAGNFIDMGTGVVWDRDGVRHEPQTMDDTPGQGDSGDRGDSPRGSKADAGATGGRPRATFTDEQRREALAGAVRVLMSDAPPAPEYPVAALGPLADACRALAEGIQVRPAMAGQSLLATAAILAQSVASVRTLEAVKPVSLYLLTIGESGDGKSTTDAVAQSSIQARQRNDSREYLERARALQDAPGGKGKPQDEMPPEPYRIVRDGTVEGIRRSFAQGVPSQGVFSSEAAAMLSGYGMNADNRAKTAATFNSLWDDGELSVSRGTVGRIQLYDRRLSVHWMIQPEAATDVMGDPLLSGIGFWPRFLIAWPEPSEPRKARPWRADTCAEIGRFWRACTVLLDHPLGDDCSEQPVLEPDAEALQLAGTFFERMEQAAKGRTPTLRDIKPFAVRATEHAFRIAGVLSIFDGRDTLDAEMMRNGIALASYSLETWRGVFGDRETRTARSHALSLYRWLLDQPEGSASTTAILKIGPRATRSCSSRDTALATLKQAGLASAFGPVWSAEVPR